MRHLAKIIMARASLGLPSSAFNPAFMHTAVSSECKSFLSAACVSAQPIYSRSKVGKCILGGSEIRRSINQTSYVHMMMRGSLSVVACLTRERARGVCPSSRRLLQTLRIHEGESTAEASVVPRT